MHRLAALATILAASAAHGADFVGAETCKACHSEAYAAWKTSRHAVAEIALTEAQRKDARCLQCHSRDAAQGVSGVSCETCHGGGQYYVAPYVMRDPELARAVGLTDSAAKTCRLCHDASAPALRPPDAAELLARIKHWKDPAPKAAGESFLRRALASRESVRLREQAARAVRAERDPREALQ